MFLLSSSFGPDWECICESRTFVIFCCRVLNLLVVASFFAYLCCSHPPSFLRCKNSSWWIFIFTHVFFILLGLLECSLRIYITMTHILRRHPTLVALSVVQCSVFEIINNPHLVGGFKHEWIIFHFIYGMSSFPLTFTHIFQDGHIAPPTGFMCLFMGKDCWVSQSNLSSRWLKPPTSHVPCLLIPYPSVHDTPVKCTGLHEGPVSWGGYFKLGWWDWKQWSIHLLSEFIYDYIYVYIHDIYVYIYTHIIYIYISYI